MENIEWELYDSFNKVDQQLLEITKARNGILITNDVALKVQAIVQNKLHNIKEMNIIII